MTNVLIWGASGHARVVADAARLAGHSIVGFLDDSPQRQGHAFAGATVLGGAARLAELYSAGSRAMHIAVGHCAARARLGAVARAHGFTLLTIQHPHAVVASDVLIGEGTFVAAGAIVNSGASIGELVIVNTASSIDHDCTIGNGAHVGPGAHLGGAAEVGEGAWLGIGAIVRDRVRIGRGAIVGAGAVVVTDVDADVVAYGVPARVQRKRRAEE